MTIVQATNSLGNSPLTRTRIEDMAGSILTNTEIRRLISDQQAQTLNLFLQFTVAHLLEHLTRPSVALLIQHITDEAVNRSGFSPGDRAGNLPIEQAVDRLWNQALPYLPQSIRQIHFARKVPMRQLLLLGICLAVIPTILSQYEYSPFHTEYLHLSLQKAGFGSIPELELPDTDSLPD